MIGVDTSFLVAWAIPEHPEHAVCRQLSTEAAQQGRQFGLTLGILAEFIHVATDPRRFQQPLSMEEATSMADFWARATEVSLLQQDVAVSQQWLDWMTPPSARSQAPPRYAHRRHLAPGGHHRHLHAQSYRLRSLSALHHISSRQIRANPSDY